MGIFDFLSDPDVMTLATGLGKAATPIPGRTGMGWGTGLVGTFGDLAQGAGAAQNFQQGSMANQMGALNLQRAQAMQPMLLNMMKGQPGSIGGMSAQGGAGNNPSDAMFGQAYSMAMMSGDMGKAAQIMQSWAEHNPALAGAVEQAKVGVTPYKTPNGSYVPGSQIYGSMPMGVPQLGETPIAPQAPGATPSLVGSPTSLDAQGNPVSNAPSSNNGMLPSQKPAVISSLFDQQMTNPTAEIMPPNQNPPGVFNPAKPMDVPVMGDGKPLLATKSIIAPDSSGTANFRYDNNEIGVADAKGKMEDLRKDNTALSQSVQGFKNEGNQIDNLIDTYQKVKSGTLTAQNPELANKLVAMGIIKNPEDIKTLGNIQTAMNTHILDTLRQLKDANTNAGGPTSRIMAGEIDTMLKEGANAGDQPDALFNILTKAKGLVDYNMDLAKGWNTIGGTGNRIANGYTMPLPDYVNQFSQSHDINDYKKAAVKNTPAFQGMAPAANRPPLSQFGGKR